VAIDPVVLPAGDFVAGHAQQNGEQLNNLLKTLHGCYLRAQEVGQGGPASLLSAS
jgi:hypothetical protein